MKVYAVDTTYVVRKYIIAETDADAIKHGVVNMCNIDDAEIVAKRVDITSVKETNG